ncbi:MAG: (2Fe-2S) ferredoxin domain-containing protein, partial [Cutibacterium acnes]|nr:(2Fe-2S) ferredoxin domain-containing protein [Cutibacterium acnes]
MTTRIAVSLRWDYAIDLDRAMTQQVAADCTAHLQGPGPTLIDVLDSIDDTRIELVG